MVEAVTGGSSARGLPPRPLGRARAAVLAALAAAAVAAAWAPLASAHAVVQPSASRPADLQRYTLTVPTERDVPTTGVDLKVPASIGFFLVEDAGPWHARLIRVNGRIDQVRWSGASTPPGFFTTLHFIARNPLLPGSLSWKVVQRYRDGKDVHWIGPADGDSPAATTAISEKAVPVDVVVGLNGGSQAAPSAQTGGGQAAAQPAAATTSGGGRDGLTFALAIVGLAVGLTSLAAALVLRRGGRR